MNFVDAFEKLAASAKTTVGVSARAAVTLYSFLRADATMIFGMR